MGCLLLLLSLMMMILFFPNFISLTCSSCGHVPIFKSFLCVCVFYFARRRIVEVFIVVFKRLL
jgi:hypothetical protein